MELTPWHAYGFRLYCSNCQLQMHVDRSQTHIDSLFCTLFRPRMPSRGRS
jgi:hypothetical protein